jgi:hypothetical protein
MGMGNNIGSKYVNARINSISGWSASSRGTMFYYNSLHLKRTVSDLERELEKKEKKTKSEFMPT